MVNERAAGTIKCLHYLVSVDLEDGGVVRAVLDLCAVLAGHGHDVTLVTFNAKDVPETWLKGGSSLPKVVVLDRSGKGKAMEKAHAIVSEANVLHLHTPWDPMNLRLAKLARREGVPYVVTIHGMLDDWSMCQKPWKKRAYLALVGQRLLERAAYVHCTAQEEQRQAKQWFPRGKTIVLPYILDIQPFVNLPRIEEARRAFPVLQNDAPKVLFLSRVHPKKGVEVLIRAVAMLHAEGMTCETVIAGPGNRSYINQLQAMADEQGVADHVHFVGMVKGSLKLSLYQACDVFVLPTHQENFGLVLPEAMACGTPVVTTRGVDIWREIQAVGMTIAEGNPQEMSEAIRSLLAQPAELRVKSQAARQWVMTRFEPEQLAEEYAALYWQARGHRS